MDLGSGKVTWPMSTLGDVAEPGRSIVSGPFGSNIGSRFFVAEGVPVIRGNNLTTDLVRFVDDGFVFLTEEKAVEFRNCEAVPGDLVITAAGSLGQVGIIPERSKHARYIISNKQMRARLNRTRMDPLFAYYWLASPTMVAYIQQRNTGSSVPLINLGVLKSLPIPVPPLTVQRAILDVLCALDAKIELNRRMNQTLEAMARALFKSWFVDFEPVVAKSEGRPTGLPPYLDALFPSEFEDSLGGEIPKGWSVESLDSIAAFLNGLALQKFPVAEGEPWLPVIKIAQLRKGVTPDCDRASLLVPSAYVIGDGDLLFSWSGSLEVQVWTHGCGALNQHLFKVTSDRFEQWFVYHWLLEHLDHFRHVAASKATTMGHIQRSHLTAAQCIVPSEQVLLVANDLLAPIHQRCIQNSLEMRDLTRLRDDLLPRLLSGEVEVAEAEEMVLA